MMNFPWPPLITRCIFLSLAAAVLQPAFCVRPFIDSTHKSTVFGQDRRYRIFLPPGYEESGKRYPVIYYFHGHSDRYTLERYDNGKDTVPKILNFVAAHDVIVVAVDGYVAEHYTGFYGGMPWDITEDGGDYDFGEYFHELVRHIDSTYRTLTDRRHRATSGLSMGGFMSLFLSARYPGLIGSASAFNPSPESFAGDKGRRTLWSLREHAPNHSHTMVRLIRASGDYISQFHEEIREAYARFHAVDFEYRQDEYHRHWATSIGETFAFHMRAFEQSSLDNVPEEFDHANAYRQFGVWGYRVEAEGDSPGLTCLESVRQGGMRVTTRRWAPDGPPVRDRRITVTTAPLYRAGKSYRLLDHNLSTGETAVTEVAADESGRIRFQVDGAGHQVSFAGPGTGAQPPVLLPVTDKDTPRFLPAQEAPLPIRVYNPRGEAMTEVSVTLTSEYPTVELIARRAAIPRIEPGELVDLSGKLRARFTGGAGYFAPARIDIQFKYDGWYTSTESLDLLIAPEIVPAPAEVEVLDGRTVTFTVFRQRGNSGGGSSIKREVTEGSGDGDGVLEPGEEATIWVKMVQGMDPFDKSNWYRCKIYSDSQWLEEVADIQETRQRSWVGWSRTSRIRLSAETPPDARIPLILDNESWTFHFTPDVRYGTEKLYQGFQLHTHHLHRYEIGGRQSGTQTPGITMTPGSATNELIPDLIAWQ